jgi:hypothetical protein
MSEGQWRIAAVSRLQEDKGGESIEYPGRLATCPRGHVRVLPTRFSKREFELKCGECKRNYLFVES